MTSSKYAAHAEMRRLIEKLNESRKRENSMVMAEGLHERIAAELRSLDGHDMTDGEYIDALADAVGSDASGTLHERIADLVEPQLPERVEWPRFEDGGPVGIGDDVSVGGEPWKVRCAILREECWALSVERDYDTATVRGDYGERVKRPSPKVLDADGVPIEVGDTVYCDDDPEQLIVDSFDDPGCVYITLAKSPNGILYTIEPSRLSHECPDSWERIADELEGAEKWCDQNGRYATGIVSITESKLREWSDRIRKLAKREGTL